MKNMESPFNESTLISLLSVSVKTRFSFLELSISILSKMIHVGGVENLKGGGGRGRGVGFLDIIFHPFQILFLVSLNR